MAERKVLKIIMAKANMVKFQIVLNLLWVYWLCLNLLR
jgi:hypothetical protein